MPRIPSKGLKPLRCWPGCASSCRDDVALHPLAGGPQDAAAEQSFPLRDRWHARRYVRRSFSHAWHGRVKAGKARQPKSQ